MKFTDYQLHPSVQAGIDSCQFVECTPIQSATIPHILAGQDIAGLAQTGTGKTAAFVLPLMDRIVRSKEAEKIAASEPATEAPVEAAPVAEEVLEGAEELVENERPIFKQWKPTNFILVLVPTRELAEQVHENVKKLGGPAGMKSVAIYGGTGYEHQTRAISAGLDFIVATPGRLIDLYKEHQVDLAQVRAVIFDEADRMFDMGFKDDMKYVLKRIPKDRQFLVFSATLNFDVLNTAYEFGANPIEVNVSKDQTKAENVEDEIFHVGHNEKTKYLVSLLKKYQPKQAIIFSNFKNEVQWLSTFLSANGLPAMGISSLISQSQRTRIMEQFRETNNQNILVATDVAARGLDIKGVDMVFNFQLPDDAENYVHRIGRTGRAGEKGRAFSLVSERDVEALQRIETYLGHKVTIGWIEDSELVTDMKHVRDTSRDRRPEAGRGAGGPRREGGPRRDGGPQSGPRREGGPRRESESRGGDRPYRGGGAQAGGPRREGGAQGGPRREGGPRHESGPRREGESRGGDRPYRGGGAQGPRRESEQRPQRSAQGGRPQHARSGENSKSGQSTNKNRRPQQSYRHKPNSGPAVKPAASAGVIGKVGGFFKKLFG